MSFVFADLFAGIGGFRLALESIGGTCVFSSEWDKYAQMTYKANFGDIPSGDLTKIDPASIPNIDLLTAGFPCQPFSSIGKREGFEHPTQGTLFYDVVKILKEKQPKAFILENVEGLVTHDGGKTLKIILDTLSVSINGQYLFCSQPEVRYHVFWRVLDAKDYGVPQVRKRIFIVGISEDVSTDVPNFDFSEPILYKEFIGNHVEENISGYSISKHLQDAYLFKLNDGKPELIDRNSKIQVKTLCSTYHKIQRLTGTFVRGGETGIRLLSENECKAIMGYPQSFIIPVSRTQMYRQFGNSVAVPVVQRVATQLVNCLNIQNNISINPNKKRGLISV
ncbi:DNA cytosine methyltransferase [Pseudanabaena mucicola]|uniref:Cytosine-specific methyltransferase n=1 Tax=Pseudanabaena mucicola FACHB-723 TaxID=2692860 RepID=A0ABR7ZT98_9CYAN|nr:DNA cytosine methyltransferase [Pseudanabaena mucicola]MBD2187203.1 DNA cytosine methyltransferase [Pseudanabaena mucicola FACHB-723]